MFPIGSMLAAITQILAYVGLALFFFLAVLVFYRFYGDALKRRLHLLKKDIAQGRRPRLTKKNITQGRRRLSLTWAILYYAVNSVLRPSVLVCLYVVVVFLAL